MNNDPILNKVMVTRCSGDIGISVCKVLKQSGIARDVVGWDTHDRHPGDQIYDSFEVVPHPSSENYMEQAKQVLHKHGVDALIPICEDEIYFLFKNNLTETLDNIPVILPNFQSLKLGMDKLETARFLEDNDLPFPKTGIIKESGPDAFPCIVKGRFCRGSKAVQVVDEPLYGYFSKNHPDYIWQELLLPNENEYTCGLFRAKNGETRSIIIKRELKGGFTGFGQVEENSDITNYLNMLASAIDLNGAINVQLRLTDNGPVIFEINSRFSSTVAFRHLMGFKDLQWTLEDRFSDKISDYLPPVAGTKIFRGFSEFIIPPS